MLRAFAKSWSKLAYIFKMEREAGLNEALGKVQQAKGAAERKQAADKKAQADVREARIKEMAEMEEKGYWECENGHELSAECDCIQPRGIAIVHTVNCAFNDFDSESGPCPKCGAPAKFIKRDLMSGQEKYESDKGRKESEALLANLRSQIEAHEQQAGVHDAAEQYFMNRA